MNTIRIAVSACLLGERVRYDGKEKRHALIMQLADEFVLQAICPEVAIGLGTPRVPVQLVASSAGIRACGVSDPELDISERIQAYAQTQCKALQACAGMIFKSRSPSCGLGSTPLFDRQGRQTGLSDGLFAGQLRKCLPDLPMVEDSALNTNDDIAEFVARVRRRAQLR